MKYYLAERCIEDSSIVEKRSIVCVDEPRIFFIKGQTDDVFELDNQGDIFCSNDSGYSISRLSETRTNELLNRPSLRWGNLNKVNRLRSYRK